MTKKTYKKGALLSSIIALLLCCTMLIGTTFAWFTDSAASGSNVITSGNLDIDVQYTLDGENWAELDGATDLFQKGLWEPGHTEVVLLRIANNGSLALKYAANMNIISETNGKTKDGKDIILSDILTVNTCTQQYTDKDGNVASGADIFPAMTFNGDGGVDGWIGYQTTAAFKEGNVLKNDKQLLPKESDYIAVKVDMAETVGNEANHNGIDIPEINFGVNVLATQYTHEYDSFGNQYDKDSEYGNSYIAAPQTATKVTDFAELKAALVTGGDIAIMNDIAVNETLSVAAPTVIYGQGNKLTFAGENSISMISATNALTIKGLVIDGQNKAYVADGTTAIATTAALTIEGCEIKNFNGTQLVRHSGNSAHAVVIKNTNIHDNNILGDSTSNRTGAGVLLYLDEAATLLDNVKIVNNTVANGNNTWGASNTFSSIIYGRNAGHTLTTKNITVTGNTAGPVYVGRSLAGSTVINFESGLIEHTSTITVFNSMTVGSGMTIKVSKINFSNVNSTIKSTLTNNGLIEADIVNGNTSRGEPIYTGTGTHTGTITGLTIQ